jgi:hypothetical protein
LLLKSYLRMYLTFMNRRFRPDKDLEVWQVAFRTAEEQYEACRIRLDALDIERAELVEEMNRLRRAMESMAPFLLKHPLDEINQFLIDYTPPTDVRLTDACRALLEASRRFMTPIEVRDALEASKYDLTQHSNPLASIHGVLKRFVASGEAQQIETGSKTSYKLMPRKQNLVPLGKRVEARLIKQRPEWAKYLAENGGIIVANPPYFVSGRKLSNRQVKEAEAAISEEQKENNS